VLFSQKADLEAFTTLRRTLDDAIAADRATPAPSMLPEPAPGETRTRLDTPPTKLGLS